MEKDERHPGEPGLSGDAAILLLDNGRIVQVPVEYVEPSASGTAEERAAETPTTEPEPSPGEEDEAMASEHESVGLQITLFFQFLTLLASKSLCFSSS